MYDFSDGIATIVVYSFNSLETLGELIKGCFEKKSNFKKVLFQTFDVSPDTPFIGIRFVHNGTIVLMTLSQPTRLHVDFPKVRTIVP